MHPFRQVRWRDVDDGPVRYGQVDYADVTKASVYPFDGGHVLVWLGAEIDELEVRPHGAPSMHPGVVGVRGVSEDVTARLREALNDNDLTARQRALVGDVLAAAATLVETEPDDYSGQDRAVREVRESRYRMALRRVLGAGSPG